MEQTIMNDTIYLIGNGFRIYLVYQLMKVFFHQGDSNRMVSAVMRAFLYILYFTVNSMGYLVFAWPPMLIIASNLIGVFLITLSYSGSWQIRLISSLAAVILNVACEDLAYQLAVGLGIRNIITVAMTVSNIMFLIAVLVMRRISDLREGGNVLFSEWLGLIIISLISLGLSAVVLDRCEGEMVIAAGECFVLLLDCIVFYMFDHLASMYSAKAQLAVLDVQNQAYRKQIDILHESEERISAIRHDMKNHIIALQHMAQKADNESIQEYLDRMNGSIRTESRFSDTGDILIDGIINIKLGDAVRLAGADVICKVKMDRCDDIDKMDLNIILGNVLDNAVQALQKCSTEKILKLTVEKKQNVLLIRECNTYSGQISRKYGRFVTSKADKKEHGLGIKNIQRIADKYNGDVYIGYDDKWFNIEIMLFME